MSRPASVCARIVAVFVVGYGCGSSSSSPDVTEVNLDAGPTDAVTGTDAAGNDASSPEDVPDVPDDIPSYITEAKSGEWKEIGTNTVRSVLFDYSSSSTPDGFRAGVQGLMDAWSGGAYATDRHRLYINGGGHRDYDGNEWYAFNMYTQQWERVNDPSLYLPDLPGASVDGINPDGTPIAIHTYGSLVYGPTTRRLYRMGRGGSPLKNYWSFDPDTRKWVDLGVPASDPYGNIARWDPASRTILLFKTATQASGWASIQRYDPATNNLEDTGKTVPGGSMAAIDTKHRTCVYGGSRGFEQIDLATHESTKLTTSGETALEAVYAPGFVYDSRRDRFTGWGAEDGDLRTLYHLSHDDWKWSAETPSDGATPTKPNTNGIRGRFQYVPEYDVFILVTRADGPVMMWKPRDWFVGG